MNVIKIISLNGCPYSMAAEGLIKNIIDEDKEKKINIEILNVSQEEKNKYQKEDIKTFPQIYYNNILLGGYDNFNDIYLSIKGISDFDEMINILKEKTKLGKRKDMLRLIKFIIGNNYY